MLRAIVHSGLRQQDDCQVDGRTVIHDCRLPRHGLRILGTER
eukprot:SAG11_NODE_1698_length_4428_cov_2.031878_3_plen_42_part_00